MNLNNSRHIKRPENRYAWWRSLLKSQYTERRLMQGRRDRAVRPSEFSRAPSSGHLKLSGTNSVPIGNSRKPGVVLGAPPPGRSYVSNAGAPLGISTANMEPVRNMRVRGAPPPSKESYERVCSVSLSDIHSA
jgi:hypothetical protein